MLTPTSDYNTFFSLERGDHLFLTIEKMKSIFHVYHRSVSSVHEMAIAFREYAPLVRAVIICGHGSSTSIRLGDPSAGDDEDLLTVNNVREEHFSPLQQRKIQIVLFSCLTGNGGVSSLAFRIHSVARVPVLASTTTIKRYEYEINPLYSLFPHSFPLQFQSGIVYDKKEETIFRTPLPIEEGFYAKSTLPKVINLLLDGRFGSIAVRGIKGLIKRGQFEEASTVFPVLQEREHIREVAQKLEETEQFDLAIAQFEKVGDESAKMAIACIHIRRGAYERAEPYIDACTAQIHIERLVRVLIGWRQIEKALSLASRLDRRSEDVYGDIARTLYVAGYKKESFAFALDNPRKHVLTTFARKLALLNAKEDVLELASRPTVSDDLKAELLLMCIEKKIVDGIERVAAGMRDQNELTRVIIRAIHCRCVSKARELCARITDPSCLFHIVPHASLYRDEELLFALCSSLTEYSDLVRGIEYCLSRSFFQAVDRLFRMKKTPQLSMYITQKLFSLGRTETAREYFDELGEREKSMLRREGIFARKTRRIRDPRPWREPLLAGRKRERDDYKEEREKKARVEV